MRYRVNKITIVRQLSLLSTMEVGHTPNMAVMRSRLGKERFEVWARVKRLQMNLHQIPEDTSSNRP